MTTEMSQVSFSPSSTSRHGNSQENVAWSHTAIRQQ
jgi:hypothetical protein